MVVGMVAVAKEAAAKEAAAKEAAVKGAVGARATAAPSTLIAAQMVVQGTRLERRQCCQKREAFHWERRMLRRLC